MYGKKKKGWWKNTLDLRPEPRKHTLPLTRWEIEIQPIPKHGNQTQSMISNQSLNSFQAQEMRSYQSPPWKSSLWNVCPLRNSI